MAKRTVMRSSKGKKLYAVRDKKGKFEDIQQYSRAHASDIKRSSKAEKKAGKKAAKKTTKRRAAKKTAAKRRRSARRGSPRPSARRAR
jgi:ferric-dicitrate binding protein FerR (iron transport regulator)